MFDQPRNPQRFSIKKVLTISDILFRAVFCMITFYDLFKSSFSTVAQRFSDDEAKLSLIAIGIVIIGFLNTSALLFPCSNNIQGPALTTFLILLTCVTFDKSEFLMIETNNSLFSFRISKFLFYFILFTNLFCFFVIAVWILLRKCGIVGFSPSSKPKGLRKLFLEKIKPKIFGGQDPLEETKSLANFAEKDPENDALSVKSEGHTPQQKLKASRVLDHEEEIDHNKNRAKICIVCYRDLLKNDITVAVPGCRHEGHAVCVRRALQSSKFCLCCKKDVEKFFEINDPFGSLQG